MKRIKQEFRHIVPILVYAMIYLSWFAYLEAHVTRNYTLIHTVVDDYIPFCELFIIPYFLWFGYISIPVLYFLFHDKVDYYRTITFLFTGMTVFLIISTFFPNGQHLRPLYMERNNIFTAMVSGLYKTDTPTNLWPSIHVYNSLGIHFAVMRSRLFEKKKWIKIGSFILCTSIILSTMFLKQHSFFDVTTAFVMAAIMHMVVYRFDLVLSLRRRTLERASARKQRSRIVE